MLRSYSTPNGSKYNLGPKVTTIGSGECDLQLNDPSCEEQHAVIEFNPSTRSYWIRDLESSSGTSINGEQIYKLTELQHGDSLNFGFNSEFTFEEPLLAIARSKFTNGPASGIPNIHPGRHTPTYMTQFNVPQHRRPGSLDRFGSNMHRRRKVIANAWQADRSAFSATSASSSGSWGTINKEKPSLGSNWRNEQRVEYLKNKVNQLEKNIFHNGSSKQLNDMEPSSSHYQGASNMLQRVLRLEAELSRKNNLLLEQEQELIEDQKFIQMQNALEESERQKDLLNSSLSKAKYMLRDREKTISELVLNKHDLNLKDQETDYYFNAMDPINYLNDSDNATNYIKMGDDHEFKGVVSMEFLKAATARRVLTALIDQSLQIFSEILPEENCEKEESAKQLCSVLETINLDNLDDLLSDWEVIIRNKLADFNQLNNSKVLDHFCDSEKDQVLNEQMKYALDKFWTPLISKLVHIMPSIHYLADNFNKDLTFKSGFSEWAHNFKASLDEDQLTSLSLEREIATLQATFDDAGLGYHWFPVSFIPVLRSVVVNLVQLETSKPSSTVEAITDLSMTDIVEVSKMKDLSSELQLRNTELESAKNDLSFRLEENDNYEKQLTNLRMEIDSLQDHISDQMRENLLNKDKEKNWMGEKAALQTKNDTLQSHLLKLQNELKLSIAQRESDKLNVDHQNEMDTKDTEIMDLKAELMSKNNDNLIVQNTRGESDEEVQQLRAKVEDLEKELADKKMSTNLGPIDKLMQMKVNENKLRERMSVLQIRTNELERKNAELEDELRGQKEPKRPDYKEDAENQSTNEPFWDLSSRLATLLDINLNEERSVGIDSFSPSKTNPVTPLFSKSTDNIVGNVERNKENAYKTTDEVVSGVQSLLERVRRQNEELNTYRDSSRLSSDESEVNLNGMHHKVNKKPQTPKRPRKASIKTKHTPTKIDFPMKVVTFDLP